MGKRRLKSMRDLSRYMQNLINRLEDGELDPQTAGKLGFLINIQRAIVEKGDLEERIEQLELRMNR